MGVGGGEAEGTNRGFAGILLPSKLQCNWGCSKIALAAGTHGLNRLEWGDAAEAKREKCSSGGVPLTELLQELYSLATAASYACLGWLNSSPFHGGCGENQLPH